MSKFLFAFVNGTNVPVHFPLWTNVQSDRVSRSVLTKIARYIYAVREINLHIYANHLNNNFRDECPGSFPVLDECPERSG